MKKLLLFLLLLLPMAITSCGGDDDEPSSTKPTESTEENKVHEFRMSGGRCQFYKLLADYLYIEIDYRKVGERQSLCVFFSYYLKDKHIKSFRTVSVGKKSKISDIKQIPTSGWISANEYSIYYDYAYNKHIDVDLNDGFIAEIYDGSTFTYYRFLIVDYVKNASGNIVDVVAQYQSFKP